MTLDEMLARESIRDVMARCNHAGDLRDGAAYAACFTEDGVLQSDTDDGGVNLRCQGREAILAWQSGASDASTSGRRKPRPKFAQHCITTSRIAFSSPTEASGRTYWFVITEVGPDHAGVYNDQFRKVGEDWLFAERRVHMRWHAPASVFVTEPDN